MRREQATAIGVGLLVLAIPVAVVAVLIGGGYLLGAWTA